MGEKVFELGRRLEEVLRRAREESEPIISESAKEVEGIFKEFVKSAKKQALEESIMLNPEPLRVFSELLADLREIMEKYKQKLPALSYGLTDEERIKNYYNDEKSKDITAQQVAEDLNVSIQKAVRLLKGSGLWQQVKESGKKTRYIRKPSGLEVYTKKEEPAPEETPTGIRYDSAQDCLYFNDVPLKLKMRGKNLLRALAQSPPNKPIGYSTLIQKVFPEKTFSDEQTARNYLSITVGRAKKSLEKAGAEDPSAYIKTMPGLGIALYPQGKKEDENPNPTGSPLEEMLTPTPSPKRSRGRSFPQGETKRILEEYTTKLPVDTIITAKQLYEQLKDGFGGQAPPSTQVLGRILVHDIGGWEKIIKDNQTIYVKKEEVNLDNNPSSL